MRRKVLVGFVLACLVLGAIPITTIAQPSPPTEFEGQIEDKDIKIHKIEEGYEIGLKNHLWAGLYVFFDGVYQGKIGDREWGYFYTPCQVTHIAVVASEEEGRAWYCNLQEEDYPEIEDIDADYLRINLEGIGDKNPNKPGIQGVVEIPFEYHMVPNLKEQVVRHKILIDGHCIIDQSGHLTITYKNAKVMVPLTTKSEGSDSIKVTTHLFENGIHHIEIQRYLGLWCYYSDAILLDFQNDVEIPDDWEGRYTKDIIDRIINRNPSFDRNELESRYNPIYQELKDLGYSESEIMGGIPEFVGDIEKHIDGIIKVARGVDAITWGIKCIGAGAAGPEAIAGCLILLGASTTFFFVLEEAIESTDPVENAKYSAAPVGDLEGNVYVVYAITEFDEDYTNAKLTVEAIYSFFLNERGEWKRAIGVRTKVKEAEWYGTEADCVEWIEKPTTIEEGETKTFKLTIKDNVIPNLNAGAMHLDFEIPKGVEISNVRVKGAEDEKAKNVKFYRVQEMPTYYSLITTSSEKGKTRVTIDIPTVWSVANSEEFVLFDITVEEGGGQKEPLKISYGLIPGKVHTHAVGKRHAYGLYKDANPLTVKQPQTDNYGDQLYFYEPFELKHSFEITPSVLPEIDFDALFALIADFFESFISALNELVITLKEKTISVPPEQKAIENVEEELSALASMVGAYSEWMNMIYELSGMKPPESTGMEFSYQISGAKFCKTAGEAQTYMGSEGIESTEISDAIDLIRELELEKEGFCIVIVDYSFTGYGEYESGRYPVVCNEKGDPFWQSWQFYEKIKGEIEESYEEYK